MHEAHYQPTDQDIRDWATHCASSYPAFLDHEGEPWVGEEETEEVADEESMDGDHESALESVYGSND